MSLLPLCRLGKHLSPTYQNSFVTRYSTCLHFSWFSENKNQRKSYPSTKVLEFKREVAGPWPALHGKFVHPSSRYTYPTGHKFLDFTSVVHFSQGRLIHQERTRYSQNNKIATKEKEKEYLEEENEVQPDKKEVLPRKNDVPLEKKYPVEKKGEPPSAKMSLIQKFKAMYRDYWYVLVPVHVVTSGMFFGAFYYMASIGVDIAALAEWANFGEETLAKIRASGNSLAGHLTIAYLLYKVMTPIRYTVTLGGTTISINYLRKWGLIKPMPKSDELIRIYDEKKAELRKKRDSFRERQELMKKSVISKLPSKKRVNN